MPFALIGFCTGPVFISGRCGDGGSRLAYYGGGAGQRTFAPPFTVGGTAIRLVLVIGCMVFARSAAMAFNRYLDRQFDAKNPRTAVRIEIQPASLRPAGPALYDHQLYILYCLHFFLSTGSAFFFHRLRWRWYWDE